MEGYYDSGGDWHPGDLEERLAALGVRKNREALPLELLAHLCEDDRRTRLIVDAFIQSSLQSGRTREDAIGEFLQESAYTWVNRLIALRCMEARTLIDEVIIQKDNYGGRSLKHHRLTRQNPEICAGEDDGLYAALTAEFVERAEELPLLFSPDEPVIALKPGVAALKKCIQLLSAADEIFTAPDTLGWAYQYWNTEEKDRVFANIRTVKGAKIEKADIIPVTQLYTEPYMVKFLVQNSLGALWMTMYPESRLCESWEYYVRDADRAQMKKKSLKSISFLDPCVGSGHFLLIKGVLRETTIETLAHLGPGAFGEISGEVVNIVLFTLSKKVPTNDHRLTAFRLIGPKSPEEKDRLLRQALNSIYNENGSRSGN